MSDRQIGDLLGKHGENDEIGSKREPIRAERYASEETAALRPLSFSPAAESWTLSRARILLRQSGVS
jgi:hypothetical protein